MPQFQCCSMMKMRMTHLVLLVDDGAAKDSNQTCIEPNSVLLCHAYNDQKLLLLLLSTSRRCQSHPRWAEWDRWTRHQRRSGSTWAQQTVAGLGRGRDNQPMSSRHTGSCRRPHPPGDPPTLMESTRSSTRKRRRSSPMLLLNLARAMSLYLCTISSDSATSWSRYCLQDKRDGCFTVKRQSDRQLRPHTFTSIYFFVPFLKITTRNVWKYSVESEKQWKSAKQTKRYLVGRKKTLLLTETRSRSRQTTAQEAFFNQAKY